MSHSSANTGIGQEFLVVDPCDPILQLLAKGEGGELGVVALADSLEQVLEKLGLLYRMDLNSRMVGMDPANRDKAGGNAQEVVALIGEIGKVGWSWAAVAHATCVEVIPGDRTVEEFNKRLADNVNLAPVDQDSIRFGSLSCGHTNLGLRCIVAAVKSDDEHLSRDGRFCLEAVRARSPEMAKAVAQGLHWKVLSWKVRVRYPKVLSIIQAARNTPAMMQRVIHEVQGLMNIHQEAASCQGAGKAPNWEVIKRKVLRTLPPWAEDIDAMILFVIGKSGGENGRYLQSLVVFHRLFVARPRRVAGPVFRALAEFPCTLCAYAILFAAYMCPKDKVIHGVCSMISETEINQQKKKDWTGMEEILMQARRLLKTTGLPEAAKEDPTEAINADNQLMRLDATLLINMARMRLGKQEKAKKTFANEQEVLMHFLAQFAEMYPNADLTAYRQAWPAHAKQGQEAATQGQEAATSKAAAPLKLYEINVDGQLDDATAQLRSKGFDIGRHAAKKGTTVAWQIVGAAKGDGEPNIELKRQVDDHLAQKMTVSLQAFVADWRAADPSKEELPHAGWPQTRFAKVEFGQVIVAKGSVMMAVGAVAAHLEKYFANADALQILSKPQRKVICAEAFGPGELLLAPESVAIKAVKPDETMPDSPEVILKDAVVPHRFFLGPCASEEMVSPFWCLQQTEKKEEASMTWAKLLVSMTTGVDYLGTPQAKPRIVVAKTGKAGGKGASANQVANVATEQVVTVPVLVNPSALAVGTEIKVFKQKAPKREKELDPISLPVLSKMRKIAETS